MKIMTKTICALVALSASAVYAQEMQQAPKASTPAMDPNPSARWGVKDGYNLFMTAEALVFKFSQDASPYAYKTQTNGNTHTYAAWGDYQWGFRVAGGYNIAHDKWDLVATYTRFSNSMSHTIKDTADSTLYTYAGGFYDQAVTALSSVTNKWKINYNVLDVEQGRQFFVSKFLRLRPKFGLRNLWLSNSQTIYATTGTSLETNYSTNSRQNFWGMGVLAGLDTVWTLGQNFSIYGNVGLAGLFGYVNPKMDVNTLSGTVDSNQYRTHHRSQTKANLDLAIGLRWDRNFSDDRFHIAFNAGFEQHVYFNMAQDYMFSNAKYQETSGSSGRDFTMSGFAFGGRFDY